MKKKSEFTDLGTWGIAWTIRSVVLIVSTVADNRSEAIKKWGKLFFTGNYKTERRAGRVKAIKLYGKW